MGIGIGTGATIDAIARARYMERQMQRRRLLRQRIISDGSDPVTEETRREWEDYACWHLCVSCGYLADTGDQECPACGRNHWTDLRRVEAAEELRKLEHRNRHTLPSPHLYAGQVAAAGLGVTTFIAVVAAFFLRGETITAFINHAVPQAVVVGLIASGVAAALGYLVVPRALGAILLRRRPVYPSRWRLPLPLPDPNQQPSLVVQGEIVPRGAVLHGPLSGRECVAYEVTVLFDAPGDRRPPMWVLEEEHSVGFDVAEHHVDSEGVTIQVPASLIRTEDGSDSESRASQFLRQRGLFVSEGRYDLYEAIIEPNRRYRLERYHKPEDAVAVLKPER